jgi:hypothetical protein
MTTEPSVLRCYGLGANLIGNTNPIGSFLLEMLKGPATTAPSNALFSILSPSSIIIRINVMEVKDLRQTIATMVEGK